MYKLLLATDDQAIRDAFAAVKWEMLGYRQPRVAASVEEAVNSLNAHHADAIAIGLSAEEDAALVEYLLEARPNLPIMAVSRNSGHVENHAVELRKLLNRIHADVSNTTFTTAEQLQVARHDFFRAMMDHRIPGRKDVERLLRLTRSKMDPHKPCVVAELSMPEDSDFLKGRWQYGPERLELALRNIFGVEVHGLRILSCVLPGERIVLLGCPMLCREIDADAEGNSMTGVITTHVRECIDHVDEFLGLDLKISSIRILPALTAMARDAE
ncbi:MAG: hypothetical protein IJZ74_07870 [Clostridia bacterium]|nr:hypothetical protein [Clostridia bacterium]